MSVTCRICSLIADRGRSSPGARAGRRAKNGRAKDELFRRDRQAYNSSLVSPPVVVECTSVRSLKRLIMHTGKVCGPMSSSAGRQDVLPDRPSRLDRRRPPRCRRDECDDVFNRPASVMVWSGFTTRSEVNRLDYTHSLSRGHTLLDDTSFTAGDEWS